MILHTDTAAVPTQQVSIGLKGTCTGVCNGAAPNSRYSRTKNTVSSAPVCLTILMLKPLCEPNNSEKNGGFTHQSCDLFQVWI